MSDLIARHSTALESLLPQIRQCRLCADELPEGPNPVLQAAASARVLIVGQAPGRRVHHSGIPFDDPSGDRLRQWMDVDRDTFYDPHQVAIVPMAFCYPGTGRNGDLPPPPRCAETWRERLLQHLPQVRITLVIGAYAHRWHLPGAPKRVTDTVRAWEQWWPRAVPLPHPSPRNRRWPRQNPWFEAEVIPAMQEQIRASLS